MILTKILSLFLCFCLILEQSVFAQTIDLSHYFARNPAQTIPQSDKFRPLHLRYISYDNQANDFKILLDKGDQAKGLSPQGTVPDSRLEQATQELMKYFFIGLSLPNEKFWVNLRPDSLDNILDPDLEKTDIGRIFLEADLQLKKDTSGMTSPQTKEGKEYWEKLYKKAEELLGYENITIPTLTRPWIVPGEIIIRETADSAYIYKATLKVMLEQDYLKDSAVYNFDDERLKELNEYSSQLIREIIIPKLTKEVNSSKRYASLRQVYYSLIMAQWFKARFQGKKGEYYQLINSQNLVNLTSKEFWSKTTYFKEYQKSFKDGEYNIKKPVYIPYGQTIRSYFSGGTDLNLGLAPFGAISGLSAKWVNLSLVPTSDSPIVNNNVVTGFKGESTDEMYNIKLLSFNPEKKQPAIVSSAIFSFEDIGLKIFAIHATPIFPVNGILKAGMRSHSDKWGEREPPSFRPTIHFSLGEVLREHGGAIREENPYAVVAPLKSLHPQLINVSTNDTFILGNFQLSQGTTLVVPKGTDVSTIPKEVTVKEYNPEIGLRAAVDQVIKERGGYSIRMLSDGENIGSVAYIDDAEINSSEFFAPLFEELPYLSYGVDVYSERGEAFRFGNIGQMINHAIEDDYLNAAELQFYKATILHHFKKLKEWMQSTNFPPEAKEVFEEKERKLMFWIGNIDKKLQSLRDDNIAVPYRILAVFLCGLSPKELAEFLSMNQQLFKPDDLRKLYVEYAIRRWIIVKNEQAKGEGLEEILSGALEQIIDEPPIAWPFEWPFDVLEEYLTYRSNRLNISLRILQTTALKKYFTNKHRIIFTQDGPHTLKDVLRAHPRTKILFTTVSFPELNPTQKTAYEFLRKIGRIYQKAISVEALEDFREARLLAFGVEDLRNSLASDLDTIMKPMNSARTNKAILWGTRLNLYESLRDEYSSVVDLWRKVNLDREFRQMFPDDNSFLRSDLSLFEIYQKLVGSKKIIPKDAKETGGSSPLAQEASVGGIDFRSLPIVTQAIGNLSANMSSSAINSLISINLNEEWLQIERMASSGTTPSSERIKEYIQTSCVQDNITQDKEKILLCISDILRLQEERCESTDATLKDILVVLESMGNNQELRQIFLGEPI